MGLRGRLISAIRNGNKPAWAAALALAGTYAAARAMEHRRAGEAEAAPVPRGWPFWRHVLYRTYEEISDDRLLALAAGVVFFALLALFPAITALVSSYALFADAKSIGDHLATLAALMPQSAYGIVNEQVLRIVSRTTGELGFAFFLGLALALWSANAGVKAIIDALNIVYGIRERRGIVRLNLVSLAFTAGAILALLLAFAAVVVLPVMLSYLPLYGYDQAVSTWLRWPALLAMLLLGLALLYRFGPDRGSMRMQWISWGAVFAAVAWLAGSAVLSWYLGSFANYDATYGSLGAGIGLMMWLWMSAIVVLVGAELNSEIENAERPRVKEERIGGTQSAR